MKKITSIIIIIIVIIIGAWFLLAHMAKAPTVTTVPSPSPSVSPSQQNQLPNTYTSSSLGFSIRYPANYTVNTNYSYQALGPGKSIKGVQFIIDPALANGTNLSKDTYISVEEIPNAKTCSANLFLDSQLGTKASTMTENGTTYSVASSTGAAAGNRYEEVVYALPGTNPCVAVRYFIHYGAFENYPQGAVKEFNEVSLKAQFDAIRSTLIINQTP